MVATSPVAATSESIVTVPINQEQPQSDRQDLQMESYIWRVILSPALNGLQSLLEYLKVQLGVSVANCRVGSLMITVTCSSLQILEGLWKDYSSGHLNKVVEQTLVTPDVLEKLGLSELKLKTTISEEEYNKCKEFLLNEHKSYSTPEQGRRNAQEENERRMRELRDEMERESINRRCMTNKNAR
ncbi:uncharacterized protein LOC110050370 [Orbicella faveolata]|uniref:uncharacterized protein LOC110050370 n=1 Tax=Orbicella faveolata TaxID=48498 RepID=UPI0009E2664A|nr:uncharacterized protein LOC110050370 [Orbicella faveolata]